MARLGLWNLFLDYKQAASLQICSFWSYFYISTHVSYHFHIWADFSFCGLEGEMMTLTAGQEGCQSVFNICKCQTTGYVWWDDRTFCSRDCGDKSDYLWQDIRTFTFIFWATKPDIFDETSGHLLIYMTSFGHAHLCFCGKKTRILWQDIKTFQAVFVATKLVCSQEFWDIDSHVCGEKTAVFVETSGHLHPKFVVKKRMFSKRNQDFSSCDWGNKIQCF